MFWAYYEGQSDDFKAPLRGRFNGQMLKGRRVLLRHRDGSFYPTLRKSFLIIAAYYLEVSGKDIFKLK